jgi:sulfite reductase (NADPH) hemoprotein beta-component
MSAPAKVKPITTPSVFTANRLRDGRVVWLGAGDAWVERVAEAAVFAPAEHGAGLARAKRGEAEQRVVGVYGVEVALKAGAPVPVKFRERLRAQGPSIAAEPADYRPAA